MDGIWFDPAHSGCGFDIRVSAGGVAVYYFGHDAAARAFWCGGFGSPNHIVLSRANGSGFPTDPASVKHEVVGSVRFELRGGVLLANGEILTSIVDPGFSPPPPAGHMTKFSLSCLRLL